MASAIISKLTTENVETWKGFYDKGEGMRREHGVRGVMVLRDATSPNQLTIVTRFDSVDAAKKMLDSDAWKEATRNAKSPITEAYFVEIADEKAD